jgi:hypothetical protein
MIYLPNIGEVPISLSSDPDQGEVMGHTIRYAGQCHAGHQPLAHR